MYENLTQRLDIEPFSDKKFSYWTKTDFSVTLYNEKLLSDGYKQSFQKEFIEKYGFLHKIKNEFWKNRLCFV